jgi:urease accessory protein
MQPLISMIRLFQMTDSAFPVGGYAFSDGLEAYVQQGRIRSAAELRQWLAGQLQLGWGRLDLPAAALAWQAWPNPAACIELDQYLTAAKAVAGPREASLRVGAHLARSLQVLYPDIWLPVSHHAVVFGAAARALGVAQPDALAALASQWLMGKATAATRLFSIGGLEVQGVVHSLEEELAQAVQAAGQTLLSELGSFSPGLDLAAHAQRSLSVRLFQS